MKANNFMTFSTFKKITFLFLVLSILSLSYGEKINLTYAEGEEVVYSAEEVLGETTEIEVASGETQASLETTETPEVAQVTEPIIENTTPSPQIPTIEEQQVPEVVEVKETKEETVYEPESDENYSPIYVPPKNLKVIDISLKNKPIITDKLADHSCSMEFFSVHMSQRNMSEQKIFIKSNKRFTKDISISELPQGFNAYFKKNNKPTLSFTSDDNLVMVIQKSENAQKGNFNIPIVITENESKKSIQICQLNLINE